jgi:hypothetical protein
MKGKILLVITILVICAFSGIYWVNRINNTPYADIRNQTISSINVKNNKVIIKGHMHSKLTVVTEYSSRVEDDAMYIKIMMLTPFDSKRPRTWFFEKELPLTDNIEKIFFEDNKRKIMVWDKTQGYDVFDIEDMWKAELQNSENNK